MNLNILYIFTVENINKLSQKEDEKTASNNPPGAEYYSPMETSLPQRRKRRFFYFVSETHLIHLNVKKATENV